MAPKINGRCMYCGADHWDDDRDWNNRHGIGLCTRTSCQYCYEGVPHTAAVCAEGHGSGWLGDKSD